MPKPSGLMNDVERGVCSRIKLLRETIRLSQLDFASKLGITVDQLTSIEYDRTPLRYALGEWVCYRFDVNQRWLAEGKPPMFFCIPIDRRAHAIIPPNLLFSEAYAVILKPFVEGSLKNVAKALGSSIENIKSEDAHLMGLGGVEYMSVETFNLIIGRMMQTATEQLPPHMYQQFYSALGKAEARFFRKNQKEIDRFRHEKRQVSERALLKKEIEKT